eukprot:scaffold117165_cov26-Tisochrysis_lutea.AAC.3
MPSPPTEPRPGSIQMISYLDDQQVVLSRQQAMLSGPLLCSVRSVLAHFLQGEAVVRSVKGRCPEADNHAASTHCWRLPMR